MSRAPIALASLAALTLAAGCRGQQFATPPRRLFDDMVWQQKLRPQARSSFFADGRAMRTPPANTVAQTTPLEPEPQPLPDEKLAQRGRERFEIYCSPCHDRTGGGRGMVVQRGFPPPVELTSDRVRGLTDQQLFDTITNGARNMPSYAAQVPPRDRWAIALWLRVLQRSGHATLADVPEAERARIRPEDPR